MEREIQIYEDADRTILDRYPDPDGEMVRQINGEMVR